MKFYSKNLDDAISLAHASFNEGTKYVIERADFHIADIKQYDNVNPLINYIEKLKLKAIEYEKTYDNFNTLYKLYMIK